MYQSLHWNTHCLKRFITQSGQLLSFVNQQSADLFWLNTAVESCCIHLVYLNWTSQKYPLYQSSYHSGTFVGKWLEDRMLDIWIAVIQCTLTTFITTLIGPYKSGAVILNLTDRGLQWVEAIIEFFFDRNAIEVYCLVDL